MEFFNKKEEVIDLQLTQFGRHILSKGKFKPVYYSFHDDNILYNVEFQDITIGVIGLVNPNLDNIVLPENLKNILLKNPISILENTILDIKNQVYQIKISH